MTVRAITATEGTLSLLPPRWVTLPPVVYLFIVTQLPFFATIVLSLHSWNLQYPRRGVHFVGLANYVDLFAHDNLLIWLANSLLFAVVPTIISAVVGLALAVLLDHLRFGRALAYALLLSPFLVMETVSPLIWKNMILSPAYGVLTWILQIFGLPKADLVSNWPRAVIGIMTVWQWAPFMMMVLLAGLQSVPEEQIEAAILDDVSARQRFSYIKLPHLRPYFVVAALLQIILTFSLFGSIYVATYGGPGDATTNLMFGTFRILTEQYEVGKAAAAGIVAAFVTTVLMLVFLSYIRPFMERGDRA